MSYRCVCEQCRLASRSAGFHTSLFVGGAAGGAQRCWTGASGRASSGTPASHGHHPTACQGKTELELTALSQFLQSFNIQSEKV